MRSETKSDYHLIKESEATKIGEESSVAERAIEPNARGKIRRLKARPIVRKTEENKRAEEFREPDDDAANVIKKSQHLPRIS